MKTLIFNLLVVGYGMASVIFAIFLSYYRRFTNPDMTETRLFIEFWQEWIFCIYWVITGYFASFLPRKP